jgi:hypothetical protein
MLLLKTKSFIGGNGGRVGQPVITSDGTITIIYSDAGGTVRAVILDDTSTTATTTTTTTTTIYVQQIIEIF